MPENARRTGDSSRAERITVEAVRDALPPPESALQVRERVDVPKPIVPLQIDLATGDRRYRFALAANPTVGRICAALEASAIARYSSGQTVELPVPEGLPPGRDLRVILTFRDSSGRRWVRWPNGKLQSASLTRRWKAHRPANRPPVV